jgi:hypothetical protein
MRPPKEWYDNSATSPSPGEKPYVTLLIIGNCRRLGYYQFQDIPHLG